MAEDENIKIIFIHDEFLMAPLWKPRATERGLPGNEVSF
jgi:membrane-associated protease RseP (regulator of RpoE activity)